MKTAAMRLGALVCLALAFTQTASAELIYGIAAVGNATGLVTWDSGTPGDLESAAFLTGLQANETIVGIDVRPATGQLYGLGSTGQLYTLNTATGAASAVGSGTGALNGFSFGFDFNPTIDRIRSVSETNKNRVINPITGALQLAATDLAYGAGDPNVGVDPNVVHSAYNNNFSGAQTSQLYGIDTGIDALVMQANNAGTLTTVGPLLTVNAGALGGFDISGATGTAYAALLPAGGSVSNFYTINLLTGTAVLVGQIDGGLVITAMTVASVIPEPSTLSLAGLGLLGCVAARRKAA
jgi:hypothetical protein